VAKCLVFPVGIGAGLRYARCVALRDRGRVFAPDPVSRAAKKSVIKQGEGAMDLQGLLILLIVGAIAGWLAGVIMRGFGFGLVGNIIVGIVGAVIAGWLLPQLGIFIGSGIVGSIINALIGAVILLFIIGLVRR
jgi:uncharacterized membrane protein YeaQ/YmgE (transglycosylase-associated protein family)